MTIFSLYFPLFLSLSLSFLLPTVINLFKNTIHHLLGLATPFHIHNLHLNSHNHISSLAAALGINVLQSEIVNPERETADHVGGEVNHAFISCTDSLASESSDERSEDFRIDEINNIGDDYDCKRMRMAESRGKWRRDGYGKNKVKSFPPPLSSLNRNGQPRFFLRPVRKNGRLQLSEVRIHRPEILHASRKNGRLRLHLVPDESFLDDLEEEQEEDITVTEEEEKKEVEDIKYKKEWKFGMRCHEMVNHHVHGSHHHHHHHHMQICGVGLV